VAQAENPDKGADWPWRGVEGSGGIASCQLPQSKAFSCAYVFPMAHCQLPRRFDLEANGVADFRFLVFKPVRKMVLSKLDDVVMFAAYWLTRARCRRNVRL
jgi:hypothetical protein